ncbi:unnamed protein product [Allacma fusca]|uniref:beta-glucosidase n=1 Tax=Allacma fusca TaxID=39272 RepID=A0A8J2LCK0_9HEXA|nr:unnamed protein product [Allacma fusca]
MRVGKENQQQGKVGITLDSNWNEPLDRNNASDVAASQRALKFNHGWIANPLFRGEYPPIMRKMVDEKSAAEGRAESRLPTFSPEWVNIINGTLDFLGLNHYTTNYGYATSGGAPGHDGDAEVGGWTDPTWPESAASWLRVVPWGFRRLLNWLAMEYGNPAIYVTENGFADKDTDGLDDQGRVDYYRKYINEMLKAVKIDGVNVKGYTAWSLIDNFEWAEGYTQRFGVHYVDIINGAWNEQGRGESIWDTFTHQKNTIITNAATGDLACDSYHRFHEDVLALKNAGAQFYRFSLSWSRILPNGLDSNINQAGIDYYNRLINDLIENKIEPIITLYHWDLPQALQDVGGWPNEDLAYYFSDYARLAFKHFGDRVKTWITFNEVWVFCKFGYGSGAHAPGLIQPAEGPYQCAHTVIKAHGLAYRIYETEFRKKQQGKIGITLDCIYLEPRDGNNAEDVAAMHRGLKFNHGWIANPLFYGEYPPIMRKMVDEKSIAEGRSSSRLPSFDARWTKIINGTVDFLGLNHYSSMIVFPTLGGPPGQDGDSDTGNYQDVKWPPFLSSIHREFPAGLRRLVNWIANEYGNPPLYITESGYADRDTDGPDDKERVNYYRSYINEILKAVRIDKVNLQAYTAWSLMDNFEWTDGYSQRFGVHYIDFANGNLTRVPKSSAKFLAKVFKDNGFPKL